MRHKDPRESDMVGCYTGATRPAAFLLVCLSLSVPAWAAPSDNPVEQRDGPSLQPRGAEVPERLFAGNCRGDVRQQIARRWIDHPVDAPAWQILGPAVLDMIAFR
jgi:hypothetical protein